LSGYVFESGKEKKREGWGGGDISEHSYPTKTQKKVVLF